MISKNNTLNLSLAVALLVIVFQTGCTTTKVKETSLLPTEAVEAGTGLAEITDPNQIPEFKDDYGRIELLYTIDKSRKYFEKVESYPDS